MTSSGKPMAKQSFNWVKKMGAALICAAGFASAMSYAAEEKVLNIYHWSDYMADDTIANFEKETGIKVNIDYMDNNEILHAKLVAGNTGYDIVVPTLEWAKLQMDGGLFQKLDKNLLPNLKNIDPAIMAQLAKMDPGNQYLLDWMWGYTTIGINEEKVKAALGSTPMPANEWDLLFKPEYLSKLKSCGVSFLDSASEVIPTALHYLGKDPNSKDANDYKAVGDLLKKVRPFVTKFSGSGYIEDLANGEVCIVMGWSGDIGIARQRAIDAKNGNRIKILVPSTGARLMFDTMAIPADAKHPQNAHLFMNYIMQPKVSASLSNAVMYANPNKESLPFVHPSIASDKAIFLSKADLDKMFLPAALDNNVRRMSTRTFNEFKTGR